MSISTPAAAAPSRTLPCPGPRYQKPPESKPPNINQRSARTRWQWRLSAADTAAKGRVHRSRATRATAVRRRRRRRLRHGRSHGSFPSGALGGTVLVVRLTRGRGFSLPACETESNAGKSARPRMFCFRWGIGTDSVLLDAHTRHSGLDVGVVLSVCKCITTVRFYYHHMTREQSAPPGRAGDNSYLGFSVFVFVVQHTRKKKSETDSASAPAAHGSPPPSLHEH